MVFGAYLNPGFIHFITGLVSVGIRSKVLVLGLPIPFILFLSISSSFSRVSSFLSKKKNRVIFLFLDSRVLFFEVSWFLILILDYWILISWIFILVLTLGWFFLWDISFIWSFYFLPYPFRPITFLSYLILFWCLILWGFFLIILFSYLIF